MRPIIAAAALLAVLTGTAQAQSDYPNRPITIIVNITPGSGTDLIARTVADGLKTILKQTVVVENRPGAGGSIGANAVANSEPDGYRLLVTSSAIASLPAVQTSLPYDTEKDLTPIAPLADLPAVIWISPTKGIKSINELIEKARKAPGDVMFGSSGVASASHLEVERLRAAANHQTDACALSRRARGHRRHRGGPRRFRDRAVRVRSCLHGQQTADRDCDRPQRSVRRSSLTFRQSRKSGLKMRMGAWVGLFGPKGMPADLVQKIHAATVAALQLPEAKDRFAKLGGDVMPQSPGRVQDDDL